MKKKLTLILLLLSTQVLSQYRPQNGVSRSQPQSILIINAKIYKGGNAILESGSILIENDKVVSVGRTIKASEHTLVFDMEGRTILPSFIELNSSVGIAPQILKKGKKGTIVVVGNALRFIDEYYQELGDPFRRDAMKKPVKVAGISKADMKKQPSLIS